MSAPPVSQGFWSAEDTSPPAIEHALERLLRERSHEGLRAYAPARVLNLLAVGDAGRREEVVERLERMGRTHPSRIVLCMIEARRQTLDAWATMACEVPSEPGALAVCRERVELSLGPCHFERLESVIDSLLVPDLPTVVWSPHGYDEAVDALLPVADVVLVDLAQADSLVGGVERAVVLARSAEVVDLAWLRTTPWRERVAGAFDPPEWREALEHVERVTVRHRDDSTISGLLLVSWLVSRLGWAPGGLRRSQAGYCGRAFAEHREVELTLEPHSGLDVPGLCGMTVETATGLAVSLDRSPGGLATVRHTPGGPDMAFTVLGASRGESGVLSEALRTALVPDPSYRTALSAAAAMLA